ASAAQWFRQEIYDGEGPVEFVRWLLIAAFIVITVPMAWIIRRDRRLARERKEGRVIRGPTLVTPSQFNRAKSSDGIGFETMEWISGFMRRSRGKSKLGIVRIPRHEENSHFVLAGDSGTGKTSLMRQILAQV